MFQNFPNFQIFQISKFWHFEISKSILKSVVLPASLMPFISPHGEGDRTDTPQLFPNIIVNKAFTEERLWRKMSLIQVSESWSACFPSKFLFAAYIRHTYKKVNGTETFHCLRLHFLWNLMVLINLLLIRKVWENFFFIILTLICGWLGVRSPKILVKFLFTCLYCIFSHSESVQYRGSWCNQRPVLNRSLLPKCLQFSIPIHCYRCAGISWIFPGKWAAGR